METHKISPAKVKSSIFTYATVLSILYIVFFLCMKLMNLEHVTELRMANYVILFSVCFFQLKRLIGNGHNHISYLKGLGTVFFTGMGSFVIFNIFLFIYVKFDADFQSIITDIFPDNRVFSVAAPYITIFFEGSAMSIIVALILMQYFRKYHEDEEDNKMYNMPHKV